MKKLARRLVVDRTTLTRNLAPLERRNLVELVEDSNCAHRFAYPSMSKSPPIGKDKLTLSRRIRPAGSSHLPVGRIAAGPLAWESRARERLLPPVIDLATV